MNLARLETVLLLVLAVPPLVLADDVKRISIGNTTAQPNGASGFATFSADGRYAAFDSRATNLVIGDTNSWNDVFVRDRVLGTTVRASVSSAGVQGNGESYCPMISADGRYVLFSSLASNLVPGDINFGYDVFVRDLAAGTTEIVSVNDQGQIGNGSSYLPTGSADMRYVTFVSDAMNLDPNDTNFYDDVFVRDRVTQTTVRINLGPGGAQSDASALFPVISGDGRYVVYSSLATNLVLADFNGFEDVFRFDRQTGITEIVSLTNSGAPGLGHSEDVGINVVSPDGRFVVFASTAPNLVPGDNNGETDVFVRDMLLGTTLRASVGVTGQELDADSVWAGISADGRYVAFESDAGNVGTNDVAFSDVFLRDLVMGTTELVSASAGNTAGNQDSYSPCLTPDARHIAFNSFASNLIVGDTNFLPDVYVRSRCFVEFEILGAGTVGSGGFAPLLSGTSGACKNGFAIESNGVLGATAGIFFVGTTQLAQPLVGGVFFISLVAPNVAIPFVFPGAPGVPGAGASTFAPTDASSLEGTTLLLQFAAVDPLGIGGAVLSNGLRFVVDS